MLNHHPLGIYEKAFSAQNTLSENLAWANTLGFEYMEISIDEADDKIRRLDWSTAQKMQLLSDSKACGVDIRSMCLSAHRRFPFGSEDAHLAQKAHELMEKAISFANFFGIRVIQLAGYDVYYEASTPESKQKFLEGMQWASRLAGQAQVMLAMEIMDTPFMNSISKHLWYEQQIHSPWFKVYPDLGNLSAWGNDVVRELEKGIDSIVAVHVKDTLSVHSVSGGTFKGVQFGAGCVDFVHCFKTLERLGYAGPYLIEMWSNPQTDDIQAIRQAKQFVCAQFEQA